MLIKNLIEHIKLKKIIKQIIQSENLLVNLSKLFSTENYSVNFKQDWIGRIYAVVNPIAQDPQARIFEYDEHGMNVKSFVNKWVMERMVAANNFIVNNNLFEVLTYEITPLDEDYNFLFVLTPISWHDLSKSLKRNAYFTLPLLIIAIVCLIIFL